MMFNVTYAAGAGQRRLHAGQWPLPGHRRAGGSGIRRSSPPAYWLFQRTGQAPSPRPRLRVAGGGRHALGRRPAQQLLSGLLPADRAARRSAVPAGSHTPPDQRAGSQAEDRHDVVAVQLRPDHGQFLLRAELGNALLEAVVRAGQPQGPGPVPRRAVSPGQHVQPGEQRPGVPDVPAHGRIRPLALTVTVEPQVQLDQPGNVGTTSFGKRSAVSRGGPASRRPPRAWWNSTRPSGSSDRVFGLPMSCSSAASRTARSPSARSAAPARWPAPAR